MSCRPSLSQHVGTLWQLPREPKTRGRGCHVQAAFTQGDFGHDPIRRPIALDLGEVDSSPSGRHARSGGPCILEAVVWESRARYVMSVQSSSSHPHVESTFDRFRPYLHLIAQSNLGPILRRKLEASDVVQQTLLQAHRDMAQFRGTTDAELMGWLRQILRRRLLDFAKHWQGQKRDARREQAMERAIDDSIRRVDDWLMANQTSISKKAIRNEELLRLSSALEQLPEDLRQVIVLHHLQGMKFTEIATRLGCEDTTVARRLSRGLKKLKRMMDPPDEP